MWFFSMVKYDYKSFYNKLAMKKINLNQVTVVIPTYNSEKTIEGTLNSIYKSIRGRGPQLVLGAENTNTDWIFFLHSDSTINKNNIIDINKFITNTLNNNKAASFKIKFNTNNIWSNLLSILVNIRSKYLKLPYGDQGLLISKSFYKNIGGYKNIPIMEDVEIIRAIGFRNIKILNSYIITDAERFENQGWIYRPMINLFCLTLYFLGFNINYINKIYKK